MTRDDFTVRVMALQDTMFRVSYSLLPSRYDQEDAVQESIRIALQKLSGLREERYFNTWMIRILIHECYNILRKRKREFPSEELPEPLPPDGDADAVEALMALDVKLRLPILLNYVEGYTIREIAQMLRVPESTIKSRMARGRTLAREMLLEEGGTGHEAAI